MRRPARAPGRGRRRRTPAADDAVERQRQTLAYWDLVVDAADSITFRLLFNSLSAAYEPALPVLAAVLGAGETAGAYRVLTAAIEEGDPDTARAAAERVLRPSTDALLTALDTLDASGGPMTDQTDAATRRRLARERLAADEARITGPRRRSLTSCQVGGSSGVTRRRG